MNYSNKLRNAGFNFILGFIIAISFSSCVKEIDQYSETPAPPVGEITDMSQLVVPESFNYDSDKETDLNIHLLSNTDAPLEGIRMSIYTDLPENRGVELFSGATNENGLLEGTIKIPTNLQTVVVKTECAGIVDNVIGRVTGTTINLTLGGSNPQQITVAEPLNKAVTFSGYSNKTLGMPTKTYIGTWTGTGVPNYLSTPRDPISSTFLTRMNNSLIEKRSVLTTHPQFLNTGVETNVVLTQSSQVYVTFIHETSGYRNSIAYYTYNKNFPPHSVSDISGVKVVFPNLSLSGSGGGLVSGDKVLIGTFGADTAIGFVLMANGYNTTTKLVTDGIAQYYSNKDLNPEPAVANKQHCVMMYDSLDQKMVFGFEDYNRTSLADNDFNDAIFSVRTVPNTATSKTNVARITLPTDSDGDGVLDINDDYPLDAALAYNSYYPSASTYGHLAFEDLWPFKGDYDMNDLIVGYRFNTIKNASNKIKEIRARVYVKAIGGSFQDGFGFQIPVASGTVNTVTGASMSQSYIQLSSNKTEAGQTKATIIVFDNALNIITNPGSTYINTIATSPPVTGDTITVAVKFTTAQTAAAIGTAPFNPFMISNMRRCYEIHLANKAPTDKADKSLFGTGQDKSSIATSKYYTTQNNLPWALNIPAPYAVVIEKNPILKGYLKFGAWAQSGGTQFPDWYKDNVGYRNNTYLLYR
ncbi:LruC domain-containing protein [soil metagenome]